MFYGYVENSLESKNEYWSLRMSVVAKEAGETRNDFNKKLKSKWKFQQLLCNSDNSSMPIGLFTSFVFLGSVGNVGAEERLTLAGRVKWKGCPMLKSTGRSKLLRRLSSINLAISTLSLEWSWRSIVVTKNCHNYGNEARSEFIFYFFYFIFFIFENHFKIFFFINIQYS